jgi:hypothetical protein
MPSDSTQATAETPPTTSLGKRIQQLFALRAKVSEIKARHDAELKPYASTLLKLQDVVLSDLQESGQDSSKVRGVGTVFKKVTDSATIADKDAFRRHVIGSQDYDLVDMKANTPAIRAHIKSEGSPPPGINFSSFASLGVRADSEKN